MSSTTPWISALLLCIEVFDIADVVRNRVKVLWWDGQGLRLYYKRLERGRFSGRARETVSCT